MDLQILKALFPKTLENSSETGNIPMTYFTNMEKDIRRVCKEEGLRVIYRGPRRNWMRTFTRRADATSVVLYAK